MSGQPIPQPEYIKITMLGGFTLSCGGCAVSDAIGRTHQVWHLLEYLIYHRDREISRDELAEVLWEEEDCDNPQNALKNLVYRARTTLREAGLCPSEELIVYRRGSYRWNSDLPVWVDTEQFERMVRDFRNPSFSNETRIERAQEALALYRGELLPHSATAKWVVPLSVYLKSLYFSCVAELCELLFTLGQYAVAVRTCAHAMEIDSFEEVAHLYYLRALEAQGKPAAALEHYNYLSELFYRELGVQPSLELKAVYHRISDGFQSFQTDLTAVKQAITEEGNRNGAYCCNYEVFRNLYRIEARAAVRTGQISFVGLLTVRAAISGEVLEGEAMQVAMDDLLDLICGSLRKNDVVARLSVSQYVLLLPTQTLENAYAVLHRIKKVFKEQRRKVRADLSVSAQALDPSA